MKNKINVRNKVIIILLVFITVTLIFSSNFHGEVVRLAKEKQEQYLTISPNLPQAQQIPTQPPIQPPQAQIQPIIHECSIPQLIDPTGTDLEESVRIDNRYIVWVEFTSTSMSRNIAYYDLGPDDTFGTSDDGGKFIVNSPDWDNGMPTIHGNKVMFLSGSYASGMYSSIQLCTIPFCASSPPTTILSIPSPSGFNFYYDADFYNNLIVYSESIGFGPSIVYLYDINTGINTPILSQYPATDVEIDGDIVAISTQLLYSPQFVIYAYHIPTSNLIQVTTSGTAITPRLNFIQPNAYFLSFDLIIGGSFGDIITTGIINGLLQTIYGLDIQNSKLIGTDYDPNQNIYEILYQEYLTGDLFLQKTILASNQKILYAIPRTFNNMYPNGDVHGNNIVFNVGIPMPIGGLNMIFKNAVSQCV